MGSVFLGLRQDDSRASRQVEFEPTLVVARQQGVVVGEMTNGIVIQSMTAERHVIGIQEHLIGTLANHEAIARVAAVVGEVEDEEEFTTLVCQHLIIVLGPYFGDGGLLDVLLELQYLQHLLVKVAQIVVAEFLVVHKVPLTAGILVAPSVVLAGEVNPFRVTELVAHEVEVSAVNGGSREQTDHLVEGNTTLDVVVLVALLEVPVHIRRPS